MKMPREEAERRIVHAMRMLREDAERQWGVPFTVDVESIDWEKERAHLVVRQLDPDKHPLFACIMCNQPAATHNAEDTLACMTAWAGGPAQGAA